MATIKEFERYACDGKAPNRLYAVKEGRKTVAYEMWIMDAEYDPMRITLNSDGEATFHTEDCTYFGLTSQQLAFIAGKADEARRRLIGQE